VDVTEIVDRQRIGGFHIRVLLLCAAAMFVDGFDTQAIGYVAPSLSAALALKPGMLGPVFAAGGFGALLGTLGFAPFADRIGRKPMIIASLIFFAACSFAVAGANTIPQLLWLRFAAGLGLGGVVPNALALTAEYMPKRLRVTLVLLVWFGFSTGSGVAGPVVAYILGGHSWRAAFVFGGILPILLVPLLAWALPESLNVLIQRGAAGRRIGAVLRHLDPRLPVSDTTAFSIAEKKEKGFPVVLLFREGRAPVTLLLWVMFFMNLMALFFMNSWLPTVMHNAGLSERAAIIVSGITHFGGIAGGLAMGPLCDRLNRYVVLAVAFVLSSLTIASIGLAGSVAGLAAAATFFAGFFTFGAQNAANAIAATSYPTAMRSTGVGWALGIGRTGQVVGPLVGGFLLSLRWPANDILYVVALPGLVAAVAALLVGVFAVRSIERAPAQ
jgi:AAHS family 4-hydroxybenzoate transporter-like MFS transporter